MLSLCLLANFAIWRKSDYLHDLYFILKIYIWLFFILLWFRHLWALRFCFLIFIWVWFDLVSFFFFIFCFCLALIRQKKKKKTPILVEIVVGIASRCNLLWQLWKLVSLQMPKPLEKNVTEIRSRKNSFCDYVCTKCTKTVDGNFDFEKSLKRLEKYSLSGHLEAGARIEKLLLRHENNKPLGSRKDFVYSPGSLLSPL